MCHIGWVCQKVVRPRILFFELPEVNVRPQDDVGLLTVEWHLKRRRICKHRLEENWFVATFLAMLWKDCWAGKLNYEFLRNKLCTSASLVGHNRELYKKKPEWKRTRKKREKLGWKFNCTLHDLTLRASRHSLPCLFSAHCAFLEGSVNWSPEILNSIDSVEKQAAEWIKVDLGCKPNWAPSPIGTENHSLD